MRVHDLDSHLGERSPLAALEAAGARTLLLGVGYATCTALHLAEYRLRRPPQRRPYRCYVLRDGRRERLDFEAPHLDAAPFPAIGAELDRAAFTRHGTVGERPGPAAADIRRGTHRRRLDGRPHRTVRAW